MSLAAEERRYRSVLQLDLNESFALEALVQGLYDESWRVRNAAAEQLAKLPKSERAIPKLLAALADRDQTGARNSAAEALIRLGAAAAPAIIRLLSHPEGDQRRFAADILGGMKWQQAVQPLIEASEDPDANVRVSATEALGRLGGAAAGEALERKLSDPDPLVRLCALEALAEMRRPLPLPLLSALLQEPRSRRTAYRLLGLVSEPAAAELICEGLASQQRSVREAALAALASQQTVLKSVQVVHLQDLLRGALSRSTSSREFIAQALTALEPQVRAGALLAAGILNDPSLAASIAEVARDEKLVQDVVRTLGQLGPDAGTALLERIDSLSGPARAAAAAALPELADGSHVKRLAALAEKAEPEVQAGAIRALARSQSAEAVETIARFLEDEQLAPLASRSLLFLARRLKPTVVKHLEASIARKPSASALLTLSRVAGARARSSLRPMLGNADPQIRSAAVDAAAELGEDAALEFARLALSDRSPSVRCAGARALAKVSSPHAEALLAQALRDPDAWVQAAAVESVGEVGAARLAPTLELLAASVDGLRAGRAIRSLAMLGMLTPDLANAALQHADSEVVKEALLASAHSPEAAHLAKRLLAHSSWDVRAAAARVLAMTGAHNAVAQLQDAQTREQVAMAREAIAEALSELCHL
jgi:HEAT repeat protein